MSVITHSRPARRRTAAVALALVLGLGVSGCTSSDDDGGPDAPSSAAADSSGEATDGDSSDGDASAEGDSSADGADGDSDGDSGAPAPNSGTSDANSPFIVAASAVGTRSVDQVLVLHALGVSTTHEDGVPHELVAAQAEPVGENLEGLVDEATMMAPPTGTPAAQLVDALEEYASLAQDLAEWTPDDPMPAEWFEELGEADEAWVEAMEALSELTGEDLLDDLPELVMPESS